MPIEIPNLFRFAASSAPQADALDRLVCIQRQRMWAVMDPRASHKRQLCRSDEEPPLILLQARSAGSQCKRQGRERCAPQTSIPRYAATEKMPLSPRPHMFTTISPPMAHFVSYRSSRFAIGHAKLRSNGRKPHILGPKQQRVFQRYRSK